MSRSHAIGSQEIAISLQQAGPGGLTPERLLEKFPGISRSTIGRRIADLLSKGEIRAIGKGRAVRYVSAAPYLLDDVRHYLSRDWQSRPLVPFQEALLDASPALDADFTRRLTQIQALARQPDKKFLADFLIDFSWASAVLEGSTYSAIDTQALIEYGERNPDKPVEDAILILNHKNAIQHLWAHRDLTSENLCQLQALLTDDHDLTEVKDSDHFLPAAQRGVVREYEDVRLGRSAYSPPFRPGDGFIANAFEQLLSTANSLPPLQAAFYLMTRIPYLQAFANGNKRTARLAANLPLLQADLLPVSFVDFGKADYVQGMAAFYELGDIQLIQQVFVAGYVRSILRSSDIPAQRRLVGFDIEGIAQALLHFVMSGRPPKTEIAIFIKPV
jgi:Fic family protein